MPSEVYRLVVDNSNLVAGLKESEAAATAATGVITGQLQKLEGAGATGSKGIHLVNDSLKMSRKEINESKGSLAMLGEMLGVHIPRHARGMVASLEMIGPALNAAFNSVAVIAVGMAIFEAGKKAFEFFQKSEEAAKKQREAWQDTIQPISDTNDKLELTKTKLENAIAKLEHKPQNRIKEAIDEAKVAADELGRALDADIRKVSASLKGDLHGWASQVFLHQTGGTAAASIASDAQDKFNEISAGTYGKDAADRARVAANPSGARDAILAQVIADAQAKLVPAQATLDRIQANFGGKAPDSSSSQQDVRSLTELIAAAKGMLSTSALTQGNAALEGQRGILEGKDDAAKATATAQSEADKKQMQGFEAALAARKLTHELTIAEEMQFWQQMQDQTKVGSANWQAINKTLGEQTQRNLAAVHKGFGDIRKGQKSSLSEQVPGNDVASEMLLQQAKDFDALMAEQQKGADIQHKLAVELQLGTVQTGLATGALTKHEAALKTAAIHAEDFRLRLAALRAELQAIKSDTSLTPDQRAIAIAKKQNEISTTEGEQRVSNASDANASTKLNVGQTLSNDLHQKRDEYTDLPSQMKGLQDQFLQGMNTNIGNLILGERTNWASFLKQLAGTLVGNGLKMLEGGLMGMAHFADGGYTGTDPVLVGERGPEIARFSRGAYITPNNKIGGGSGAAAFYYIDAKEGDTATLNRNMMTGLKAVHGQAIEDATAVQRERSARMPRGAF